MLPPDKAKTLLDALDALNLNLKNYEVISKQEMRDNHAENSEKLDKIMGAFPDEDTEAHRRYHQEAIEMITERRLFYRELRSHLAKGIAWSLLVGICYAVYSWAKLSISSK